MRYRKLLTSFATAAAFASILPAAAYADLPRKIVIDAKFDDWADVPGHTDPEDDQHDADGKTKDYQPKYVDHPDVDILEYKLAHDAEHLYAYFRARGAIGKSLRVEQDAPTGRRGTARRRLRRSRRSRVQREQKDERRPGRYYAILTIDVDGNDETGYWLHEGGYFPTSRGYDVNAEVEWFNGEFNTGHYLNHGCLNEAEKNRAFREQSSYKFREGKTGPYPAGFLRVKPGTYDHYTQWVYHKNDEITFVLDKGPIVHGIVLGALSEDLHETELMFPLKGFLKDRSGEPIIGIGKTIDVSFSLEASGELAPGQNWASDTAEPIEGYVLELGKEASETTNVE